MLPWKLGRKIASAVIYMAMATFEPNLFSNCFLALLNSREMLFDMDMEVQTSFLVPTMPHSITSVME